MIKVADLMPGMIIENGGVSATFIAKTSHPIYGAAFALVIWRLDNGSYSFDALTWGTEVGEVRVGSLEEFAENFKKAIGHA